MLKRIITALVLLLTITLYVADRTTAQQSAPAIQQTGQQPIKQAVEKSLSLLDRIRLPFLEQTGCVSCHHNSLPAMTAALARERGFPTNERTMRAESEQILTLWRQGREKFLQGDGFPGQEFTASYTLLGLAANQQEPDEAIDATIIYLMGRQLADGHWPGPGSNRPPLDSSDIETTALSLRALQLYAPAGLRQEARRRIARARTWLWQATPRNNDEQCFQMLGVHWAKSGQWSLRKLTQTLLAEQRADGGWGQLATLASDAYATGQTLVALHQAGGLSVTHPAYQRGVRYLLSKQAADGSWLVETRAYPFQKHFESGFPHGKHQWLSAAATSWATMALTLTVEAQSKSLVSWR
jgi:hypothetical protein